MLKQKVTSIRKLINKLFSITSISTFFPLQEKLQNIIIFDRLFFLIQRKKSDKIYHYILLDSDIQNNFFLYLGINIKKSIKMATPRR